jgi:hypothetical protein
VTEHFFLEDFSLKKPLKLLYLIEVFLTGFHMKQISISLTCLLCISSFLFLEPVPSFAAKRVEEKDAEIEKPDKKEAAPKKQKAHFVGVRRPQEKPPEKKSPSSAIKNQWVKSKTHPKKNKKEQPQSEEEESPPSEMPYYYPGGSLPSSMKQRAFFAARSLLTKEEQQEEISCDSLATSEEQDALYPQLGVQAPNGHVFVTADWLLWRTRQGGMEFAVQGVSASALTPFPHSAPSKLNFDLQSGFRVGFGVHLPNDGWDIYVNFTDFHPEASKSIGGSTGSILPLLPYNPPSLVASAHAQWHIDFKNLDIEIGRGYYIGKTLSLRPFIGMIGAWIDQDVHVHYRGGSIPSGLTNRIETNNNFKGGGPRFGIGSNWHFGQGFSLFGNLAAALVVGHFDLKNEQDQGSLEPIHLNSDLNLVSPVLQFLAGLAWDKNTYCDQWHFGLSAGFETQYWWRQNQMERFTNNSLPVFLRADSDLAFYGLTLRGRFDF